MRTGIIVVCSLNECFTHIHGNWLVRIVPHGIVGYLHDCVCVMLLCDFNGELIFKLYVAWDYTQIGVHVFKCGV